MAAALAKRCNAAAGHHRYALWVFWVGLSAPLDSVAPLAKGCGHYLRDAPCQEHRQANCIIPLGLIGVIVGLLVANSSFGFFTLIGMVSLSGIIINNALALIDRINIEVQELGKKPHLAILNACQQRLRPIALAATTTVFGMTPMLWGGNAMFVPMAITIMFGLAFATLLTLLVVPVLYSIFWLGLISTTKNNYGTRPNKLPRRKRTGY